MTSDKQLLSASPRQCASRTERRSQSDTAINVTTRVLAPQGPGHEAALQPASSGDLFSLFSYSEALSNQKT